MGTVQTGSTEALAALGEYTNVRTLMWECLHQPQTWTLQPTMRS